jgi:hypothetical protein
MEEITNSEELQQDVQEVKADINPKRLADETYEEYRLRRRLAQKYVKQYLKGKLAYISTYFLPSHGKITVNPPYTNPDKKDKFIKANRITEDQKILKPRRINN